MRSKANKQSPASYRPTAEAGGFVVADQLRIRDRITARWRQRRLDLELAAGAPPESAAPLALRARRLTQLSRRRSIADALRRIVREAHEGARLSYARITPCRGRVAAASDELSRLAARLAEPGPVAARGVAQASILLTDGTGPLYNPSSPENLQERAAGAAENLRPWSA